MTEMVTLTLTGAKRFMISGTTHTVEQWDQVNVDKDTAEHLLDQYFVDKSNNEQPYFEEGIAVKPEPRADRKRIRASHRRLEREAQRADQDNEALRQGAKPPQDPYARTGENAPDWAVNTDVRIGPANTAAKDNRVFEDPTPAPAPKVAAVKRAAKPKSKRKSRAKKA